MTVIAKKRMTYNDCGPGQQDKKQRKTDGLAAQAQL